ncbi:MAG: hypothetical protein KJO54_05395 [Gammaproteobacteria bacterium]|nr:hypothetical protein [Gammaproteobacteria bacterium]
MTRLLHALLFLVPLFAVSAVQADGHRVYEDGGSVWTVSFIETKPGHFDDYIDNLNNIWRRYLDAQKKDGDVLSYKMIPISFPRDGEPNLMLMVEFKNWASFDRGNDYFDKLAKKLQGGIDKATQSNIDREALRELRGGFVGQEIKFKK